MGGLGPGMKPGGGDGSRLINLRCSVFLKLSILINYWTLKKSIDPEKANQVSV